MKAFINQMRAAWHHGRGSKFTRHKNFKLALVHFQAAVQYAKESNDQASVALELECVARAFVRLGDYVNGKHYAEESLRLYLLEDTGPLIDGCLRRVRALIQSLEVN